VRSQEVGQVLARGNHASHGELFRNEMGEGMGHLWHAAGHAAGGLGDAAGPAWRSMSRRAAMSRRAMMRGGMMPQWAMSPTLGAARRLGTKVTAMAPLAVMAPTGGALTKRRANRATTKVIMKKESKSGRRRVGMLVGLLAAGAVAGVAGAMASRRRNRMAWEEYETHGHGYAADRAEPMMDPMSTGRSTTLG
jgi:hypothetical protein